MSSPRSLRVSNGQCALYGRQASNPLAQQAHWRNRISNERVGTQSKDDSGTNCAMSLLWGDGNVGREAPMFSSRKRTSGLKMVQDLGVASSNAVRLPVYDAGNPVPSNKSMPVGVPSPRRSDSYGFGQVGATGLDGTRPPVESAKLAEATRARALGNTFLKVGNLSQARRHFDHAQRLLEFDASGVANVALDEFKTRRKLDTFM